MELYRKMYAIVCTAASEAIDQIERERAPETAAHLLRTARNPGRLSLPYFISCPGLIPKLALKAR